MQETLPTGRYDLWNGNIGVIFGARWFAAGRNTSASVTPVIAINMVY